MAFRLGEITSLGICLRLVSELSCPVWFSLVSDCWRLGPGLGSLCFRISGNGMVTFMLVGKALPLFADGVVLLESLSLFALGFKALVFFDLEVQLLSLSFLAALALVDFGLGAAVRFLAGVFLAGFALVGGARDLPVFEISGVVKSLSELTSSDDDT